MTKLAKTRADAMKLGNDLRDAFELGNAEWIEDDAGRIIVLFQGNEIAIIPSDFANLFLSLI